MSKEITFKEIGSVTHQAAMATEAPKAESYHRFLNKKVSIQTDVPLHITGSVVEIDDTFIYLLVQNVNSETKAHERLTMAVKKHWIRIILDETPEKANTVH